MANKSLIFGSAVVLLLLFLFLWAVKYFNISYPITVTTKTTSGELSVVGEGKVDIVPDTAEVSAGISVTDAKTADEAQTKIDEINNKIIDSMKRLGIDKKDIKTSNYSINPNYNYIPGGRNEASGFLGNANVTITVRQQDLLPQVLTAATEAGATNVNNNGFTVDDPSKYREQARNKAIENAKEQAQKLASQLGIHLGRITNIVESPSGVPIPMYGGEVKRLDTALAPQIEPGTQTITSTVTLYFEKQ